MGDPQATCWVSKMVSKSQFQHSHELPYMTWIWGTRLDPVLFHALHVLIHTHLKHGKSSLWSSESKGVQGANERFYLLDLEHFLGVKNREKPYFLVTIVTFSLKSIHESGSFLSLISLWWSMATGETNVGICQMICLFSAPGSTVASSHMSIPIGSMYGIYANIKGLYWW